jgi:hypothetical protein
MSKESPTTIVMADAIDSKSLSKFESLEGKILMNSVKLKKSLNFNERYHYSDNVSKPNVFKSQIGNTYNYYINVNKANINNKKNKERNISNIYNGIIKEDEKSEDSDTPLFNRMLEDQFITTVKKLIFSEDIDSGNISDECVIKEIKNLISIKEKFNEKQRGQNKFDINSLKISRDFFWYKSSSCRKNIQLNYGNSRYSSMNNLNHYYNQNKKEINLFNNKDKANKQIILDNKRNDRYDRYYIDKSVDIEQNDIKILHNSICSNKNNLINSVNIMPEIISPENMYKIFIYCIKQFDYEKKIYNKFLNQEDLKILEKFAKKLNHYIKNLYKSCQIKFQK